MAKNRSGARVVKIVFRIMGLSFLVVGGILTFLAYDFMDNALPTTGRVESVEVNYNDDSVTYKPTIRFIDYAGRKQFGETFMSSSSYNFEVGSNVDILYDIRNPESLRMDTWLATWGFGVIFLVGSIVPFGITSIIGRFAERRTKPAPKPIRTAGQDEEEMIEIPARTKGLIARESRSDHERETTYTPTVRRTRR